MSLRERFERMAGEDPAGELVFERGDAGDYAALCEHHYRGGRPGNFMRVLALRDKRLSVVGRYVGRREERRTVGVLVESMPSLECCMREWALEGRYGAWPAKQRAALLAKEMRCISRVVVHPQWRGLGLAVRLVRAALGSAQTCFTEALAAMGQVNPFFEKAGMTAYVRGRHEYDARLIAVLDVVGIKEVDLADVPTTAGRIEQLGLRERRWVGYELGRWYRQALRKRAEVDRRVMLEAAQQRLMFMPMYYLRDNRGGGEEPMEPQMNTDE